MKKINTVTIVSLSAGTIGESFVSHEIKIGLERLEKLGLKVKFSKHAMMGSEYISSHPEARAQDLIEAFQDEETDMILTAIGGDDTYRLLPYLFENDGLKKAVNKKVFLGFSDTTVNHFMLRKVGLDSFYGQAFLCDICDIGREMLPYNEKYLRELIETGTVKEIIPAEEWFEARTDYSVEAVGTGTPAHRNAGFELLQGAPVFSGKIFGGCIDTIHDMFDGERYADMPVLCEKYSLFPDKEFWKGKILLLETSEELMSPEKYEKALVYLKNAGVFDVINGIILGKPVDEINKAEYEKVLLKVVADRNLSIAGNINVGHALPRCIIPFGVNATVDTVKQKIFFE